MRRVLPACFVCALTAFSGAAQRRPPEAAAPPKVNLQKVTDSIKGDPILEAMLLEMSRVRNLRLLAETPYYSEASADDADNFSVSASFGALYAPRRNQFRPFRVSIRVGSPRFDNTNSVFSDSYSGARYDAATLPLDNNLLALRGALWLAFDRAYKTAAEAVGRKAAAVRGMNQPDSLPDFSPASGAIEVRDARPVKIDEALWSRRVRDLSAVFDAYPDTATASVEYQSSQSAWRYANSEGAIVRLPDRLAWVRARASRQAPDGMVLYDGESVVSLDPTRFDETALRPMVEQVARDMAALAQAPRGETYAGPVLFEPRAAAQIIADLFGSNLPAVRRPVAEPGRAFSFPTSELESRLHARVLPEWLDMTDDATLEDFNGLPLAGHYVVDIEGLRPMPVPVVQKGILETLLVTRQPVRGVDVSNAHARLPGNFGVRQPRISNLVVSASQSAPLADLKARLIEMIRSRGKPYGLLVRKMDFPTNGSINDLRRLSQRAARAGGRPVSAPILVYQVTPGGQEKLVRGLRFRTLDLRAFRDVLAASKEIAVFNYVDNGIPLAPAGMGSYVVGCAVVSPGLLFEDLELEPADEETPKPPLVPAPALTLAP
jgi:TldD protein